MPDIRHCFFMIKRAIAHKRMIRDSNPPAFRHRPDEAILMNGIFWMRDYQKQKVIRSGDSLEDLHLSLFFLIRPFPFDWLRCIPFLRHSDNLNVLLIWFQRTFVTRERFELSFSCEQYGCKYASLLWILISVHCKLYPSKRAVKPGYSIHSVVP